MKIYRHIHPHGLQRQLAKLAGPIFMETLLVMTLGAVDTIMLSQHSDNSVAAVGMVNQLINLVFLVFEVTAVGTSILCSQYIGAKLHDKVTQVVGVSLLLNLVFGLTVSAALYFGAEQLLSLMGLRPELMPEGSVYMRIVGAFAVVQAISMAISASLRSADKAVYPMLVTLIVNILNIIGNYTLIFGKFGAPALGVIYYPITVGIIVMWGVPVACSYLFGITMGWGLVGMWFAFLLDENIRAALFIRRWNSKKWTTKGFVK